MRVSQYFADENNKHMFLWPIVYSGHPEKDLGVKTPLQAVEKWHEIEPELFKKTPQEFKNKIIGLQTAFNQQPRET